MEDLIQESMSKGEFSNLSGVGKPLKSLENRNPYVDLVTHKLNEVNPSIFPLKIQHFYKMFHYRC